LAILPIPSVLPDISPRKGGDRMPLRLSPTTNAETQVAEGSANLKRLLLVQQRRILT
jgi:hypothetical protein